MWKDCVLPGVNGVLACPGVAKGVANGVGGGVPEERRREGGVPGQPVAGVPPKGVLGVCIIIGVFIMVGVCIIIGVFIMVGVCIIIGVFMMVGVRGDSTSALVATASGRLVTSATGRLERRRAGLIALWGVWKHASSRNWFIASC